MEFVSLFRVVELFAIMGVCDDRVALDEPTTELGSTGLTLKPRSFLTIAGVMHKFEKWVVSIDILLLTVFELSRMFLK
jgi:hypothetical protein